MRRDNLHSCRTETEPRRGFTLIELLAVIVVIGILVGLILPAVQSSRESARRLSCTNHLKQIGIAVNQYGSTYAVFPAPSAEQADTWPKYVGNDFSPLVRMLPYLEQMPVYDAVNFALNPITPSGLSSNLTVMSTSIETFLCVSDIRPPVEGYGRVNYRFNEGSSYSGFRQREVSASGRGAFEPHRFLSPAEFTDGLSQTAGASERLQGDWTSGATFKRGGDYRLSPTSIDVPPEMASRDADWAIGYCNSLTNVSIESRGGESWFLPGLHCTAYNHCNSPNPIAIDCGLDPIVNDPLARIQRRGVISASSDHSAGVNLLIMDGSVRFVKNGIAIRTWRALGTRDGGEIISSEY